MMKRIQVIFGVMLVVGSLRVRGQFDDRAGEDTDDVGGREVVVALIGDSTVTERVGWGKAFAEAFGENVRVRNFASGGRSSKSWMEEGRLPAALAARPDYVLIQFGHNDQPGKGPERETDPDTTYRDYLRQYIDAFREIEAQPILLSSVTRRTFDEEGRIASTLGPWAEAAGEVAEEEGIPFIDLHALSVAHHNELGPERSQAYRPRREDISHFNEKGAEAISGLIVEALKREVPKLAAHIESADNP